MGTAVIRKRQGRCWAQQIVNYRQRISGLLVDRIDPHGEAPLVDFRELSATTNTGEASATICRRVIGASMTPALCLGVRDAKA